MEKNQRPTVGSACCANHTSDQQIITRQTQWYYFQLNHHLRCRLDRAVELEHLTQKVFLQAATIEPVPTDKLDVLLLPIATGLLRERWLAVKDHSAIHSDGSGQFTPSSSPANLHDQASALYIKLRAFRNNSTAATEISGAIHQWIGKDPRRQTVYDQVRSVWYQSGVYGAKLYAGAGASISSPAGLELSPNRCKQSLNMPAHLAWPDVVLLVCVFLLLLPMIYFLSAPTG